jgi:RluA family pseudouridine synthase
MDISIIFEDLDILVVDKPTGIPVLPDGWVKAAPFLKRILEEKYNQLWTVHRLDKITSGVLLFARNATTHRLLNIQFEHHQVTKKYHSILVGVPPWSVINASQPLRPNAGHSHHTVVDWNNGKQASTHFLVLQKTNAYSLVEASPETGRTHQIRAHAAALSYPILADVLYGAPPTDIIQRPALHALSLQFIHPLNGQICQYNAPYPSDFQQAMLKIKFSR